MHVVHIALYIILLQAEIVHIIESFDMLPAVRRSVFIGYNSVAFFNEMFVRLFCIFL